MTAEEERPSQDARQDLKDIGGNIRLFVPQALSAGGIVEADTAQAHYLLHVMRARAGSAVRLFNGRDGEWRARIEDVTKRGCVFACDTMIAPQRASPDVWLAFAPIKKTPADYVAQKATELGVSVLQPVITRRTVASRVNLDRLKANAVEAAEQSERLDVPDVREPVALAKLLEHWPVERKLIFCDEGGDALPIADAIGRTQSASWGVLTGPEGGFDGEEREMIRNYPFVVPVTLGPRIMRADTASLAALVVLQALKGDWNS